MDTGRVMSSLQAAKGHMRAEQNVLQPRTNLFSFTVDAGTEKARTKHEVECIRKAKLNYGH